MTKIIRRMRDSLFLSLDEVVARAADFGRWPDELRHRPSHASDVRHEWRRRRVCPQSTLAGCHFIPGGGTAGVGSRDYTPETTTSVKTKLGVRMEE